MTLIVAVRSAEGIVVAGDTLASGAASVPIIANLDVACQHCGETTQVRNHAIGSTRVPLNTFPSARKVFPFVERFGVGVYGQGVIVNQTPFFAIRQLEAQVRREGREPIGVEACARAIAEHLSPMMKSDPQVPSDEVVGCQVSGYDDENPNTVDVQIDGDGKWKTRSFTNLFGYTTSGEHSVVNALNQLHQGQQGAQFSLVSLGDAIDVAEFLIRTTIDHHRFGPLVPTVGGNIDIGQVTPHKGYTWIRRSSDSSRHTRQVS